MAPEIEEKIREKASELLSSGEVDVVIGYRRGTLPLRSVPHFAFEPEETGELIFDQTCSNNLSVYLPRFKGKNVGIISKGCDARSALTLTMENQFLRDDLILIGVSCPGVIDQALLSSMFGDRARDARIEEDRVVLDFYDEEREIPLQDLIAEDCLACPHPQLEECDVVIGEAGEPGDPSRTSRLLEEIEAMSPGDRWRWFQSEFSRCNLCFACREACPACHCELCFVDREMPRWTEKSQDIADVMAFHLTRALHTADRCVGCGACERACPRGIRLRVLSERAMRTVREDFGVEPGVDAEQVPAFTTFSDEDPGEFIL